ncbi:MAG: response regulator transcription factor [Deinococcaceae bacterium]
MSHVLIIDDDPNVHHILKTYLENDGHTVLEARDGLSGLDLEIQADLLVVDWMMPTNGLSVIQTLREQGCEKPILLLTARGEEEDTLAGLDAGADDYVIKPFSPREVTARIRALTRRNSKNIQACGRLKMDPASRQIWKDGVNLSLSKIEFEILSAFLSTPGMVWSRERLLDRVWGNDFPDVERVVDVHIKNLRKKLGDDPDHPTFIETVRGVGYRLREHP